MRTHQKISVVLSVSSVAFCAACAVLLGAQQVRRAGRVVAVPRTIDRVSLRTLPRAGYGEVGLLDDGTFIIQTGGELATDAETGELFFTPSETVALWIDTTGLRLVEAGNELFLDKGGAQITARGFSPSAVILHEFADPEQIQESTARAAVFEFHGELLLELDPVGGSLALRIVDSEDTGGVFALSAPIVSERMAKSRNAGGEVATAMEENQIALTTGGSGPGWEPEQSWLATCTVDCSGGSCTLSCKNKGALCYCKGSTPVCRCINAAAL